MTAPHLNALPLGLTLSGLQRPEVVLPLKPVCLPLFAVGLAPAPIALACLLLLASQPWRTGAGCLLLPFLSPPPLPGPGAQGGPSSVVLPNKCLMESS